MASMPQKKRKAATYSRKDQVPASHLVVPSIEIESDAEDSLDSDSSSSVVQKKRSFVTLPTPNPHDHTLLNRNSSPSHLLSLQHAPSIRKEGRHKSKRQKKSHIAHHRSNRSIRRLPVGELTLVEESDDAGFGSPVSDLEADPISENDSVAQSPTHTRRRRKPQTLSTVRRTLKHPALSTKIIKKEPRPRYPAALTVQVERGSDGFTGSEFLVSDGSKRKRARNPRFSATWGILELRRGPIPAVHFDKEQFALRSLHAVGAFDYQGPDLQNHLDDSINSREPTATGPVFAGVSRHAVTDVETAKLMGNQVDAPNHVLPVKTEAHANTAPVDRTARPDVDRRKATTQSPTRAVIKEGFIYAQLSSISAPARRHISHTTASDTHDESEEDYENSLLPDPLDENQREEDEPALRPIPPYNNHENMQATTPDRVSPAKSWISETVFSTEPRLISPNKARPIETSLNDVNITTRFSPTREYPHLYSGVTGVIHEDQTSENIVRRSNGGLNDVGQPVLAIQPPFLPLV